MFSFLTNRNKKVTSCCCSPVAPCSCEKQKLHDFIAHFNAEFIIKPNINEMRFICRKERLPDIETVYKFRSLLDNRLAFAYIEIFMIDENLQTVLKCWKRIADIKLSDYCGDLWELTTKLEEILIEYILVDPFMLTEILEQNELTELQEMLSSSNENKIGHIVATLESIQCRCFKALYNVYLAFITTNNYDEMISTVIKKNNVINSIDFDCIQYISEGSFGVVIECIKKTTQKKYAVKVLSKTKVISEKFNIFEEQRVLTMCKHPFIIKLAFAYQTNSLVMLALEIALTDLSKEAKRYNGTLSVELVLFYGAEIISALCYLHKNKLIHRDVKPSNILLKADGHVILGDFGASRRLNIKSVDTFYSLEDLAVYNIKEELPIHRSVYPDLLRAYTYTGTIDFMAPEMNAVMDKSAEHKIGYTNAVDFWSLGVTLFKLITGKMPLEMLNADVIKRYSFIDWTIESSNNNNKNICMKMLTNLYSNLDLNIILKDTLLANFLSGLLKVDERERLGYDMFNTIDNYIPNIKSHEIFKTMKFNWNDLDNKKILPPSKPLPNTDTNSILFTPTTNAVRRYLAAPCQTNTVTAIEHILTNRNHEDWLIPPNSENLSNFEQWDYVASDEIKEELLCQTKLKVAIVNNKAKKLRSSERFLDRVNKIINDDRVDHDGTVVGPTNTSNQTVYQISL